MLSTLLNRVCTLCINKVYYYYNYYYYGVGDKDDKQFSQL